MSFLQPAMLLGLPLIALPIIIHLINQRRYRTIDWGAMNFLLAANRMSRGYARIRQWIILAVRALAIAGLVLAISRPLASGWLQLASPGNIDTTIILLDRSPSMQQASARGGVTKLEAGIEQLIKTFDVLDSRRWVLIDSLTEQPLEFGEPADLQTLLETRPTSSVTDLPGLLQSAFAYFRENRPTRTEIWICSDLRRNDWDPDSARWQAVRDAFLESPLPVRFHLLALPDDDPDNRSVRVTATELLETVTGREVRLALEVSQPTAVEEAVTLPLRIEVDGQPTEVSVELVGQTAELQNYSIPLPDIGTGPAGGWGRVSLPADGNLADNDFFFVYDRPPPLKTILVTESGADVRSLKIAAEVPTGDDVTTSVEQVTPGQLAAADWSEVALVIWQAELPDAAAAEILRPFLETGGQMLCFPPAELTGPAAVREFAGLSWTSWQEPDPVARVGRWQRDQGLLADVESGAELSVRELEISRFCGLTGPSTAAAALDSGAPLLATAITPERNIHFCSTRPVAGDSNLAREGIVLYVLVQRALRQGAAARQGTRQLIAGTSDGDTTSWQPLSDTEQALSNQYAAFAGAYREGEHWLAVNRHPAEDAASIVSAEQIEGLFAGLEFDRVDVSVNSERSGLLQEIWSAFLLAMMFLLIAEALLCLPRRAPLPEPVTFPPLGANG